jgi:hypothetical protein
VGVRTPILQSNGDSLVGAAEVRQLGMEKSAANIAVFAKLEARKLR